MSFHETPELSPQPLRRQAVFRHGVEVGAFVVHGDAGIGPNLAFCLCRKGKTESAIDGLNRSLGVFYKVGIRNPVVLLGSSRDCKLL